MSIKGILYGLCIGDALGGRYEFKTKDLIKDMIKKDKKDNYLPILGGGVFNLEPGQLTDDSEMAIELLLSIVKDKKYSQNGAAKGYIHWFHTGPIDKGNTIEKAISSFTLKSKNKKDMITNSSRYNSTSLSNGTLMRIAPISILYKKCSLKAMKSFVEKDCELTHPHPFVCEITWLYVYAILQCLQGIDRTQIFENLLKETTIPNIYLLLLNAQRRPEPCILDGVEVFTDNPKFQGFCGIAFQNCIYELVNGSSFAESILSVLKRGGDTDTNCCITGGLLGAYYGMEGIDKRWIDTLRHYEGSRVNLYSLNKVDEYLAKWK